MSLDLYRRLKELGGAGRSTSHAGRSAGDASLRAAVATTGVAVPGWEALSALVFRRVTREPLVAQGERSRLPPCLSGGYSAILSREVGERDILFMDCETTGLSSGAGSVAFLVGVGIVVAGEIEITQLLLGDFPGEPEFLSEVGLALDRPVWVSYNGRAFDARLLESRFLMHGRRPLAAEHLDLLHWSRRFYRRIVGSCSLPEMELAVLGETRLGDIPGMEIPGRYFAFLRTGISSPLDDVFEHHRRDILSLARILCAFEEVMGDPLAAHGVDRLQLGRLLLLRGHPAAEAVLAEVVGGDEPLPIRERAALLLGSRYRRRNDHRRARSLWETLHAQGSALGTVELAKHLEHREKAYAEAELLVAELLLKSHAASLEHRLNRLRRRLSR